MELLVVIGIIGVLAALVTPAVMRALSAARNAAMKAEIDMLHMAVMNYKNEYGSFPPALDITLSATDSAARHVARIFPRSDSATTAADLPPMFSKTVPTHLAPLNALVFWLKGFSVSPVEPLEGSRKELFDFDDTRLNADSLIYSASGKPASPYVYINSAQYPMLDKIQGKVSKGWPQADLTYAAGGVTVTIPASTYYPTRVRLQNGTTWTDTTQPYFNADTFQILCAGRDEVFGTDDDLSNFWPGTRKDYLESLK